MVKTNPKNVEEANYSLFHATKNLPQAAAHCDAVQAFISDSNDGLISDDVSEHSLTSGCPVSVGESQPNDVHAQSDFDNGKC